MDAPALALFASHSGPTPLGCGLLCGLALAPFLLLAITARSLLSSEPLPLALLALGVLGGCGVGYVLFLAGVPRPVSGPWRAWWLAAVAGSGLQAVVLVREAGRRNWFRPTRRPRRRADLPPPGGYDPG